MSLNRMRYRARQFFMALGAVAEPYYLDQARAALTPAQTALFARMQPAEQAHAVNVYRQLVEQGETSPDLLAAALLHDVGKCLSPLRLWERVFIVLAWAVIPAQARRWGSLPADELRGWRRAFVVAQEHPIWGAALAAEAGSSERTVALIRRHQEAVPAAADGDLERLLLQLQAVDDRN
jgi:HD domain